MDANPFVVTSQIYAKQPAEGESTDASESGSLSLCCMREGGHVVVVVELRVINSRKDKTRSRLFPRLTNISLLF